MVWLWFNDNWRGVSKNQEKKHVQRRHWMVIFVLVDPLKVEEKLSVSTLYTIFTLSNTYAWLMTQTSILLQFWDFKFLLQVLE